MAKAAKQQGRKRDDYAVLRKSQAMAAKQRMVKPLITGLWKQSRTK